MSGYVLLKNKPTEKLYEHWQVIEEHRGYERQPGEVCDHIDGITIHNSIENLRTFASNGKHLKATLTGRKKQISRSGRLNIGLKWYPVANRVPVDTFEKRRARGDVRLRAILRASLELGIEHPCLLGTTHWLEKAGIDPASRPNLERAWADLLSRYEQDLAQ